MSQPTPPPDRPWSPAGRRSGEPTDRRRPDDPPPADDGATQRLDTGARGAAPQTERGHGREAARRPAFSASSSRTQPVPSAAVGARTAAAAAPPAPRPPAPTRPAAGGRRVARRRVTIRKVDPWSVLKLSLIFYFCALLVVMLALAVFWAIINQLGLVDRLLDFLAELQLIVEVRAGMIARAIFLLGLLNVVLWSGINVFLAFLYNLIADLVGGLKLTLVEDA